ncbi:hypothetical protein QET93_009495 [Akkermansia sp. N21116]|uniref:beta strand repeat-containing protein n=1 Tax=Akkermansia sp. N21116 TaxID=3040764 RepID=UPI00244E9243|nr:hypothetical protein [Akkermansia sp. N21116]WPX39770.1 hypothetical protein QET93_009495 [Akkermansia sp. N21116]
MKIRLPLPLRTALLSSFLAVFSYTVQSATLSWYGENGGSFVENWWNPSPDTPDSPHRQDLLPHDNLIFGDQDPSSLEERTGLQEVIFGQKDTYGSFTLTSALDWNIATAGSVFESVSVTAAGKTLTFDGLEVTDAMTATGNLVSTGNVKVGGDFTLGASSTLTGTNLDVSGALSNAGTITLSGGLTTQSWTLSSGGTILAQSFNGGMGDSDMVVDGTNLSLEGNLSVNSLAITGNGALTAGAVTSEGDISAGSGTSLTSKGTLTSTNGGMAIAGTVTAGGTVTAANGTIELSGTLNANGQSVVAQSLNMGKNGSLTANSLTVHTLETVTGSRMNLTGTLNTQSWTLGAGTITAASFNGGSGSSDLSLNGTKLTLSSLEAIALNSLSLNSSAYLTTTGNGADITIANGLTLNAGTTWDVRGSSAVGRDVIIGGNAVLNGSMWAKSLAVNGDSLVVGGKVVTKSEVTVTGASNISGSLSSDSGNMTLSGATEVSGILKASNISLTGAVTLAGNTFNISASRNLTIGSLANTGGEIGGGTISANSLTWTTTPGTLQLNGTQITLGDTAANDWSGMDLILKGKSGAIFNVKNADVKLKSLVLEEGSGTASFGSLETAGNLKVLDNNAKLNLGANSTLTVGGDMTLNSYSDWNKVTVDVAGNYTGGHMLTAKDITVGGNVDLTSNLTATENLWIKGTVEVIKNTSVLDGQKSLIIDKAVTNFGTIKSSSGSITLKDDVTLNAGSSLLATNGTISLEGDLTANGSTGKPVTITTRQLQGNTAKTISLTNADMSLTGSSDASTMGTLEMTGSALNVSSSLTAGAVSVDETSSVSVGKDIHFESLTSAGLVESTAGNITITGAVDVKNGGFLEALSTKDGTGSISTGELTNAGTIQANGTITVTGDLKANTGTIQSLEKDIVITGNANLEANGKLIAATYDEITQEWTGTGNISIGGTLTTSGQAEKRVMLVSSQLLGTGTSGSDMTLSFTDLILTDKTDADHTAAPVKAGNVTLTDSLFSSASGIEAASVTLNGNSTLLSTQKNYTYSNNPKPEDYPEGGNKPAQTDMTIGSLTVNGSRNTVESYGNLFLKSATELDADQLKVNAWGVVTVDGDLTLGDKNAANHNTISFQGAGIAVEGGLNVAKGSTLTSQEATIYKEDGITPWPAATRDRSHLTVKKDLDYQGEIVVKGAMTAQNVTGSDGGTLTAGNASTGDSVTVKSIVLKGDNTTFSSRNALNITSFQEDGGVKYAAQVSGNGAKLSSVYNMTMANGGLLVNEGSTVSAGRNLQVGDVNSIHNVVINGVSSGTVATKVTAGSDLRVYGDVSLKGNNINVSANNIFIYDATPGTLGTLTVDGAGNSVRATQQFRVFAIDLKNNDGLQNVLSAGNPGMYVDTTSNIGTGNFLNSAGTIQFKGKVTTKGDIQSSQSVYFEGGLDMTAGSIVSGDTVRFTSLSNSMTGGSLTTPNWEILTGYDAGGAVNLVKNTEVHVSGSTKISGDGKALFEQISGELGEVKVSGNSDATIGGTKNRVRFELLNSGSEKGTVLAPLYMTGMSIQNGDVYLGSSDGTNPVYLDTKGDRKGTITLNKEGRLYVYQNSTWAGSVEMNNNSYLTLAGGNILGDVYSAGTSSDFNTNNITLDVQGGGLIHGNVILNAVTVIGDTGKTVTVDGDLSITNSTPADALQFFASTSLTYTSGQLTIVDNPPVSDPDVSQINDSVKKVIIEGDSMVTLGKLYANGYSSGTIPHEVSIRFGDLTIVSGNYKGDLLFEESNQAQNNANVSRKLTISTDTANDHNMIVLASGIISVSNDTTFTLNGELRGDMSLLMEGGGTKIFNKTLNGTDTDYTADITWTAGKLQLGADNAIGTQGTLFVKSTTGEALELISNIPNAAGTITTSKNIDFSASPVTVNTVDNLTLTGNVTGGTMSKNGAGVLDMSSAAVDIDTLNVYGGTVHDLSAGNSLYDNVNVSAHAVFMGDVGTYGNLTSRATITIVDGEVTDIGGGFLSTVHGDVFGNIVTEHVGKESPDEGRTAYNSVIVLADMVSQAGHTGNIVNGGTLLIDGSNLSMTGAMNPDRGNGSDFSRLTLTGSSLEMTGNIYASRYQRPEDKPADEAVWDGGWFAMQDSSLVSKTGKIEITGKTQGISWNGSKTSVDQSDVRFYGNVLTANTGMNLDLEFVGGTVGGTVDLTQNSIISKGNVFTVLNGGMSFAGRSFEDESKFDSNTLTSRDDMTLDMSFKNGFDSNELTSQQGALSFKGESLEEKEIHGAGFRYNTFSSRGDMDIELSTNVLAMENTFTSAMGGMRFFYHSGGTKSYGETLLGFLDNTLTSKGDMVVVLNTHVTASGNILTSSAGTLDFTYRFQGELAEGSGGEPLVHGVTDNTLTSQGNMALRLDARNVSGNTFYSKAGNMLLSGIPDSGILVDERVLSGNSLLAQGDITFDQSLDIKEFNNNLIQSGKDNLKLLGDIFVNTVIGDGADQTNPSGKNVANTFAATRQFTNNAFMSLGSGSSVSAQLWNLNADAVIYDGGVTIKAPVNAGIVWQGTSRRLTLNGGASHVLGRLTLNSGELVLNDGATASALDVQGTDTGTDMQGRITLNDASTLTFDSMETIGKVILADDSIEKRMGSILTIANKNSHIGELTLSRDSVLSLSKGHLTIDVLRQNGKKTGGEVFVGMGDLTVGSTDWDDNTYFSGSMTASQGSIYLATGGEFRLDEVTISASSSVSNTGNLYLSSGSSVSASDWYVNGKAVLTNAGVSLNNRLLLGGDLYLEGLNDESVWSGWLKNSLSAGEWDALGSDEAKKAKVMALLGKQAYNLGNVSSSILTPAGGSYPTLSLVNLNDIAQTVRADVVDGGYFNVSIDNSELNVSKIQTFGDTTLKNKAVLSANGSVHLFGQVSLENSSISSRGIGNIILGAVDGTTALGEVVKLKNTEMNASGLTLSFRGAINTGLASDGSISGNTFQAATFDWQPVGCQSVTFGAGNKFAIVTSTKVADQSSFVFDPGTGSGGNDYGSLGQITMGKESSLKLLHNSLLEAKGISMTSGNLVLQQESRLSSYGTLTMGSGNVTVENKSKLLVDGASFGGHVSVSGSSYMLVNGSVTQQSGNLNISSDSNFAGFGDYSAQGSKISIEGAKATMTLSGVLSMNSSIDIAMDSASLSVTDGGGVSLGGIIANSKSFIDLDHATAAFVTDNLVLNDTATAVINDTTITEGGIYHNGIGFLSLDNLTMSEKASKIVLNSGDTTMTGVITLGSGSDQGVYVQGGSLSIGDTSLEKATQLSGMVSLSSGTVTVHNVDLLEKVVVQSGIGIRQLIFNPLTSDGAIRIQNVQLGQMEVNSSLRMTIGDSRSVRTGNLSGNGPITLIGQGSLTLGRLTDNTDYTGDITWSGSSLSLTADHALGTIGQLLVTGNFQGILDVSGTGAHSKDLAIDSQTGSLTVTNQGGDRTTMTGTVRMSGILIKEGAGSLIIDDKTPEKPSWMNNVTVNAGSLTLIHVADHGIAGRLTANNGVLTLDGIDSNAVSDITVKGSLGKIVLTNASDIRSRVVSDFNAGRLIVDNDSSLIVNGLLDAGGSSAMTIDSGSLQVDGNMLLSGTGDWILRDVYLSSYDTMILSMENLRG